ncbi:MAG: hypothetical protein R2850_05720 [Bacteroidia bacterium]
MIKSIVLATTLLFTGVAVNAQTTETAPAAKNTRAKRPMNAEDRAVRILRMMSSKTNLSDAQSAEVKKILLEREQVKVDARNEDGTFNPAKKEEVKAANKKANDDLQKVLTPEQWTKWEAFRAEVKQRRAEKKADPNKGDMRAPDAEEDFY